MIRYAGLRHPLREPPGANPHAGWEGAGGENTGYPISPVFIATMYGKT